MTKLSWREDVKALRKKRKALGVTQAQLAKLSRVNPSTLAGIEAGYGVLNADVARQLWDVLGHIESERRSEVSLSERKLRERVEELEKENEIFRGVEGAKSYVQRCAKLPWMAPMLATAREQLAEKTAQAERLRAQQGNLDDPIIKGLLDSLYQEIEGLAKQVSEMEIVQPIISVVAGQAAMEFHEAMLRGESWAVENYQRWKETGKPPTLVIDRIEARLTTQGEKD